MAYLNAESMDLLKKENIKRQQDLKSLISEPFDLKNDRHMDELRRRMNYFELSTYKMAMYQGMSETFKYATGGWLLGYFPLVPQFFNSIFTFLIYVGMVGQVLEKFSLSDFQRELVEMQALYNWCFKGGKDQYDPQIKNDDKLLHSDMQRFIQLLAPLTSRDFMIAWDKVTNSSNEEASNWGTFFKTAASIAKGAASLIEPSKPKPDLTKVTALKTAVETGELNKTPYNWTEAAFRYFATNQSLRDMISMKVMDFSLMAQNMISPSTAVIQQRMKSA
ncbi:MAG: hypothetical protein EPN84_06335 [Legionella sp.]|nr:MAG: hypothetical protein EPN84_06335 [Legionella sp.]